MESSTFNPTEVFTDMRSGPGVFGFRWALERKLPVRRFAPDWQGLGKPAQLILCFEMAAFADACVVLTDGTDHVAEYQVKIARNCGCKLHVVQVQKQELTLVDYGRQISK